MALLRPCINKKTLEIVIQDIETVNLDIFEPIIEEAEGNLGTVDMETGSIINKPSAFAQRSAELEAQNNANLINEALEKNPSKRGRKAKSE